MTDPLVLTFAEIAFLLQPYPDRAVTVIEHLGLQAQARSEVAAAAGAASLLARGLCRLVDGQAVPGDEIIGVAACVGHFESYAEAVSWTADRPILMHLLSAPAMRLAFFPAAYGLLTVEALDPTESLAGPVARLFDQCATPEGAAVAVRTSGRDRDVSAAIARQADGSWVMSDSEVDAATSQPTTREAAFARLDELLGPRPVGARDR